MGLLGKTLKGRSTLAKDKGPPRNIRLREIEFRTKDQIEGERERRKEREILFKKQLESEQKIYNINKKKLLVNWRNIMRIAKTEQLKNQLEIYAQTNQRETDSKEAYLQMLDKNLEEAEDQYNLALRNHLMQIEKMTEIRDGRIDALKEEFNRTSKILYDEFNNEAKEIKENHERQIKELNDMADCTNEEEQEKKNIMAEAYQTAVEQTKQKAKEEIEVMNNDMRSRQGTLSNFLETLYQRYMNDTKDRFAQFEKNLDTSANNTKKINESTKKISRDKERINQTEIKINQMKEEFTQRNEALKKEKDAIAQNFFNLKNKMARFRDDEKKKLTELVLNSKSCMDSLTELSGLGEKILKTAELCRRLETEKEKVIPFYDSTITEEDIPEDLRVVLNEISEEDFKKYSYIKNYFKRYNKVMLDKIAIQQQKELYLKENKTLKRLLKQYIDDISVNDDVLTSYNPLFVTNKIKPEFPVEKMSIKGVNTTYVEGNHEVDRITKQAH